MEFWLSHKTLWPRNELYTYYVGYHNILTAQHEQTGPTVAHCKQPNVARERKQLCH